MREKDYFEITADPAVLRRVKPPNTAPIEEMETRRPSRPKPFATQVVVVVLMFYGLFWAGFSLIVYGILSVLEHPDGSASLLIAAGIAAVCCVPVAYWRVGIYDDEETMAVEWVKYAENKPVPPPKAQPVIVTTHGQVTQIIVSSFKFTADEWFKLAKALYNNDWKVTRKPLLASGLFSNVTDNYQDYIGQFIGAGWLPSGSEGNEKLRQAGIKFLSQYYPPTPPNTGVSSGATPPTTTTTTATTEEEWT